MLIEENDLTKAVAYANIWAAIVPTFALLGTILAFILKRREANLLKKQNSELNNLNPNLDVLENYSLAWLKMKTILNDEFKLGNQISIKNIGLDLEKILPDLGNLIGDATKKFKNIEVNYLGLIINPESPLIAELINGESNLKTNYVEASFNRLRLLKEQYSHNPCIKFEVSSYNIPPTFHGLLINNNHLFLGFTEIHNQKIFGSDRPYIYLKFDPDVDATAHYFTMYQNWFNHYWVNEK